MTWKEFEELNGHYLLIVFAALFIGAGLGYAAGYHEGENVARAEIRFSLLPCE